MKTYLVVLTTALLISGGIASAQQQQYDSLGSPTPAPNQNVSPNAIAPNVPKLGGVSGSAGANADANDKTGVGANGARSYTTGAGAANGGVNGPVNTGTTTPTDPSSTRGADSNTGVATPSGLTND